MKVLRYFLGGLAAGCLLIAFFMGFLAIWATSDVETARKFTDTAVLLILLAILVGMAAVYPG